MYMHVHSFAYSFTYESIYILTLTDLKTPKVKYLGLMKALYLLVVHNLLVMEQHQRGGRRGADEVN